MANILPLGAGAGSTTLVDLDDTSIGSPTNGQGIVYNSTTQRWSNSTLVSFNSIALGGITDVTITSVASDQVLAYSGTAWINTTIYTNLISNNAITTAKIANDAITSAKIADDAITSALINDNAVGAAALNVSGNGSSGQYLVSDGDGSFSWNTLNVSASLSGLTDTNIGSPEEHEILVWDGSDWVNDVVYTDTIDDSAVTTAKIASNAITDAKIAANAVGASELKVSGNGSSGQALVSDGDGTFSWSTISAGTPGDNTITALQLAVSGNGTSGQALVSDGDGTFSWSTISGSGPIADGSITTAKLADGAVTAPKIANGVVPVKAEKRDVEQGVNDDKFITSKQLADSEARIEEPVSWTGFSWQTSRPDGETINRAGPTNVTNLYRFITTQAIAQTMDTTFKQNDIAEIVHNETNQIIGRAEYMDAAAIGSHWMFEIKLHDTGIDTDGSFSAGDQITLRRAPKLQQDIINNMIATLAEAIAGTSNELLMTAYLTHKVLEYLSHTSKFVSFTHTTSTGTAMGLGTWNINSGGTQIWVRGHNATEFASLKDEILADYYFILANTTGQTIEAKYTSPSVIDVDDNPVDVVTATIGSHSANPANPTLTGTDAWTLYILSETQYNAWKNIPHGVITYNALAASAKPGFDYKAQDGRRTISTSYVAYPRKAVNPADSDAEVTVTPSNTNSVMKIFLWTLTEFNEPSGSPILDIKLQRKIGTGSWTDVKERSGLIFNATGNPSATWAYYDTPNTSSEVKYRVLFKRSGNNSTRMDITDTVVEVREKFK